MSNVKKLKIGLTDYDIVDATAAHSLSDIAVAGNNITFSSSLEDYDIVGNCSVDSNYIATGFGLSDYIVSGAEIPQSATTWEIGAKIHTASTISDIAFIFSGNEDETISTGVYLNNPTLNIGNGAWFGGAVWVDSTTATDTDYWYKLIFDGSKYSLQRSLDGSTFTEIAYLTSSTKIITTKVCYGLSETGSFVQSLDLKETYIKVNGVETWRAVDTSVSVINATVPGSVLQNTATGTSSITIGGTATAAQKATNLGTQSVASGDWSTSIGYKSQAKAPNSISLGYNCIISSASNKSIAIGSDANVTNANAYQIGPGTNSTYKSLSVGFYDSVDPVNYILLNGDGTIPAERLTKAAGTRIWISEAQEVPTSANLYLNHGLTITDPMKVTAYLYIKFVNAVAGYSVGDVVANQLPTYNYYAPSNNLASTAPFSPLLEVTSTAVVFPRVSANTVCFYDKTTGAFTAVSTSDIRFIAKIVY